MEEYKCFEFLLCNFFFYITYYITSHKLYCILCLSVRFILIFFILYLHFVQIYYPIWLFNIVNTSWNNENLFFVLNILCWLFYSCVFRIFINLFIFLFFVNLEITRITQYFFSLWVNAIFSLKYLYSDIRIIFILLF